MVHDTFRGCGINHAHATWDVPSKPHGFAGHGVSHEGRTINHHVPEQHTYPHGRCRFTVNASWHNMDHGANHGKNNAMAFFVKRAMDDRRV